MNTSISQKPNVRLRPSPWDALVVAAILALTALLFLLFLPKKDAGDTTLCTISQNGQQLAEFCLEDAPADNKMIFGAYILETEPGRIRINNAPCTNQDCVHTGWIDQPGQSIVCLPGRFVVELSSATDKDIGFDIVVS